LLLLLCLRLLWRVQLQPLPGWHIRADVGGGLQRGVCVLQLVADELPLPGGGAQQQHDACGAAIDAGSVGVRRFHNQPGVYTGPLMRA
jgi:hypothetical protein